METAGQAPNKGRDGMSLGEQLDEIMRDLDRASDAWVAAGYPMTGPESDAREAVFVRLRAWNVATAAARGLTP